MFFTTAVVKYHGLTFKSQEFHEIMPMIYKRFTEKSAAEWRQIYKALQLLEFLVKNGSERVVDYARSHVGAIEMLKHFHYVDSQAKDQGINIRNRAKELTALLGDVEKIRTERKKARANVSKYSGVGSEEGGFGGSGKKYGGFGSDSMEFGSGYQGQVFGDGGGFNGSNYIGPSYNRHDEDEFEEYDVGTASAGASGSAEASSSRQSPPPLPKKKTTETVADFISFDDEPAPASTAAAEEDDDFDDFQSATPVPAASGSSNQGNPLTSSNLADLFSSPPVSTAPSAVSHQPLNNNTGSFFGSAAPLSSGAHVPNSTFSSPAPSASSSAAAPKPKAADAFGDLWSSASTKSKSASSGTETSLASLAQQKAKSTMWGADGASKGAAGSQSTASTAGSTTASANDDLLLF